MNKLELYEFLAVFIIPLAIVTFCLTYLSDDRVKRDELKIGILELLHHFMFRVGVIGIFILFIKCSKVVASVIVLTLIIAIIGWKLNDNYCFVTTLINKIIDPQFPYRKWVAGLEPYIKKYIRGTEWSYGNVNNRNVNPYYIHLVLLIIGLLNQLKN
jgi:hypothetical protein